MASRSLSIRERYVASAVWPFCGMALPEGLVDRGALFGEHARAVLGDIHAVLEADAELAVNRDGRFVAETHARFEPPLIAPHQVGPLVTVQANAVTGAMRQTGDLVARSKSVVGDHLARSCIHRFAGRPRFGRCERGVL